MTFDEDHLMEVRERSEPGMALFNLKNGGAMYRTIKHRRKRQVRDGGGGGGDVSSLWDLESLSWLQQNV